MATEHSTTRGKLPKPIGERAYAERNSVFLKATGNAPVDDRAIAYGERTARAMFDGLEARRGHRQVERHLSELQIAALLSLAYADGQRDAAREAA